MNVLGIIPARGGSKRVKNKNIRDLAGKPLIIYTIEASLKSKNINRLIVSTDNKIIADIAKNNGAEIPFLRPVSFAQDDTPDQPVFQHALETLKDQDGYEPDIVLNLRPTTPLKTSHTIDKVIEKMMETQADIVRTMSPVESIQHPYWMYALDSDSIATPFLDHIDISDYHQRQLLPDVYRINGVVDAFSHEIISNGNMLGNNNMFGILTPDNESIDIDTEFDLQICEALLKY